MAEVWHHKNPIENYASNTYNRMTAAIIWFSDTFLFTLSSSFICAKSSPRDSDELKKNSHVHIQLPEHCPDAEDRSGERSIYIVNPEKKYLHIISFQGKHIVCCLIIQGLTSYPRIFHSRGCVSIVRRLDSPKAR